MLQGVEVLQEDEEALETGAEEVDLEEVHSVVEEVGVSEEALAVVVAGVAAGEVQGEVTEDVDRFLHHLSGVRRIEFSRNKDIEGLLSLSIGEGIMILKNVFLYIQSHFEVF